MGSLGRVVEIPLIFSSDDLYQTVLLGIDIYTIIEGVKANRGTKTIKGGIKLYEKKRLSNSLHRAVLIPFQEH